MLRERRAQSMAAMLECMLVFRILPTASSTVHGPHSWAWIEEVQLAHPGYIDLAGHTKLAHSLDIFHLRNVRNLRTRRTLGILRTSLARSPFPGGMWEDAVVCVTLLKRGSRNLSATISCSHPADDYNPTHGDRVSDVFAGQHCRNFLNHQNLSHSSALMRTSVDAGLTPRFHLRCCVSSSSSWVCSYHRRSLNHSTFWTFSSLDRVYFHPLIRSRNISYLTCSPVEVEILRGIALQALWKYCVLCRPGTWIYVVDDRALSTSSMKAALFLISWLDNKEELQKTVFRAGRLTNGSVNLPQNPWTIPD